MDSKLTLTLKQKQFCKEYIIDLNATQAAIRAGYSKKTARFTASENLTKHNISEYIQILMENRSKRTEVTADKVIKEIAKLAFFNMADVINDEGNMKSLDTWNVEDLAAIQEVTETLIKSNEQSQVLNRKVKIADKKSSLELLGRHLKLFTDRIEHGGKITVSHEDWLDKLDSE